MEVTRAIRCPGCGETGQVVWNQSQWHPDVQAVSTPLRVSGRFVLCAQGTGKAVACGRCQQIHNPR